MHWLTLALVTLAAVIVSELFVIVHLLDKIHVAIKVNTKEVERLRLSSRARVAQAAVQSGAVSDEQKLVRLGRASTARRVVVGGDDDAELNQAMKRQVEERGGEDDDDSR